MAARETIVDPSAPTKCTKCQNHYDDPRMLPCLHSFCRNCIGQLVIETGSKQTIRCPTCYNTTPLPVKRANAFARNVRLSYETTIAKYEAQITLKTPPSCDECSREPVLETVSFCCTGCGFLCTECHSQHTLSRRLAKNHVVIALKETQENIRKLLKEHIPQSLLTCTQHPEKNVEMFCTDCSELVCMQCALIQHCRHGFEELSNFSKKKKVEIKESIKTMPESVTKLEETIKKGTNTKKQVEVSKRAANDEICEAFQELREELDKREKALLAKSREIATAKETSLAIHLEELTSLRDQIVACTTCAAEVEGSYNDTELLSIITTLQTRVKELTQQFDKTPLELRENDSILVAMETETLKENIQTFGSVTKRQPRDYKTLHQPIMTINADSPYCVAVHTNGNIVVTNINGHFVYVFDKSGHQKLTFGQQHNGVTFNKPLGVAISGDALFVVNIGASTVNKLTMTGELLSSFGKGQLEDPWGCAVSLDGMIYVADQWRGNNRLQVFNPDGTFSQTIGSGQLQSPKGIAIDKHGMIHVASNGTKDVKVFTPNGEIVREYGKGDLSDPKGVAVDQDGYCLVGDFNSESLCIFDPQGKLVHTINFANRICGVTLDNEGFVYVAEYGGGKVHKY